MRPVRDSNLLLFRERAEWLNKLTESFLEQGKTGLEGINALPRTVEQAK